MRPAGVLVVLAVLAAAGLAACDAAAAGTPSVEAEAGSLHFRAESFLFTNSTATAASSGGATMDLMQVIADLQAEVRSLRAALDGKQDKIARSCPSTTMAITKINADNTVECVEASDARVDNLAGTTCPPGNSVKGVAADGSLDCEATAIDYTKVQRRVNNTCPSTSGIRSIGMDGTVQCAVADGALVTNFKSAFQGVTFPAGWKYQANTLGPIGDTDNYVDLVWKTSAGPGQNKYTYKGQSLPAESPGGWVSIGGSNSHSGYPTGVGGATFNIYAIISYTVQQRGVYVLTNTMLSTVSDAGDGNKVRVYVGNTLLKEVDLEITTSTVVDQFDTVLGILEPTTQIIVAVGSRDTGGSDSFDIDFDIYRFSTDNQLALAMASMAGDSILFVGGSTTARENDCDAGLIGAFRVTDKPSAPIQICTDSGWSSLAQVSDLGSYQRQLNGMCATSEYISAVNAWGNITCSRPQPDDTMWQRRITPCTGTQVMQGAAQSGQAQCVDDSDTFKAGVSCDAEEAVIALNSDGSASCASIAPNFARVQARVNNTCTNGYAMAGIGMDGTPTCIATYSSFEGTVVAGFRADFQRTGFPKGWRYLMNDGTKGTYSDPTSYIELQPNAAGGNYYSYQGSNLPAPNPGAYASISSVGGHAGPDISPNDVYAMAEYTISAAGTYLLIDSSVVNTNGACGDGVNAVVMINGVVELDVFTGNAGTRPLDCYLGDLSPGDKIIVAVGPQTLPHCDQFEMDYNILQTPQAVRVAAYSDDFQNPPKDGWSYLFNPTEPIGDRAAYQALKWNGNRYNAAGSADEPAPAGTIGGYVKLAKSGDNHPGNTAPGFDIYAIAGFEPKQTGHYMITNAFADNLNTACGNGINLRVYVNDNLLFTTDGPTGTRKQIPFNVDLGLLTAGDVIYVAGGPAGSDACDGYSWDFDVIRMHEL